MVVNDKSIKVDFWGKKQQTEDAEKLNAMKEKKKKCNNYLLIESLLPKVLFYFFSLLYSMFESFDWIKE